MGIHLIYCGSKTNRCPICGKDVERAILAYHVDNNCIDLFDNYSPNTPEISSNDITTSLEENNISVALEVPTKENALACLRNKIVETHDSLTKDYFPIEVNHLKEKLQFNIVVMGSPRVGKSQLINAICNDECKAQTSPSLNSCTKKITCYRLEDNQEQMPGIQPFRVNFYDTPGIESWNQGDGKTAILDFIEKQAPICIFYCAAPGSFADLSQIDPVLEFCKEKKILWVFVCTNMWSNSSRNVVIHEFENKLAIFGNKTERIFQQADGKTIHKVTIFDKKALCTMVNSVEYYDPDYSSVRKPVQGVDELIHCVMETIDDEKLLGWCYAVLYRRTFWEKFTQRTEGFISFCLKNMKEIIGQTIEETKANIKQHLLNFNKKKSLT